MPRYRKDETDGPRGPRDSLRQFYGGQPPQANRKVGSPWDTTGRDDARRSSDDTMRADEVEGDEDMLDEEELAAAMRGARRAAERREDEDDDGDGDAQPRLRVRCPDCGSKFEVRAPTGMRLSEIEDEDQEESEDEAQHTVRAMCPECEARFAVAPPKGYRFEDEEEDAKDIADTTDEDEEEDEAAGDRHLSERGRRQAAEALANAFFARYRGKLLRESRRARRSTGSPALDAFVSSYREARKLRRSSGMP